MPKTIDTSYTLSDKALRNALGEIQGALVDQVLTTAGLAIGTTSTADVRVVNTIHALIDGVLVRKTAAEVDLTGTVVNATFNVFVISMNSAGTLVATMGTAGATIGAVVFPTVPANQVVVGFVIINPTGTGNFVGNTTALSDATVVPNAVYISTVGSFNPNLLAL